MGDSITIISKNVVLKGDIFDSGTIDCSGNVEGNILTNTLIIKQNGNIHGKIFAKSLTVSVGGKACGDIVANNIKICKDGEITGNVKYNTLSVEDGGKLNIKCDCLDNNVVDNIVKEYRDSSKVCNDNNMVNCTDTSADNLRNDNEVSND